MTRNTESAGAPLSSSFIASWMEGVLLVACAIRTPFPGNKPMMP
jgi:hypothetical protein